MKQNERVHHQVSRAEMTHFLIAFEEGGQVTLSAVADELIGPPMPGFVTVDRDFLKK